MVTEAPSTVRERILRERRSRGVAVVAPVEVGEGGTDLLIRNELLKQHQTRDRKAVGAACCGLGAMVHGPWCTVRGTGLAPPNGNQEHGIDRLSHIIPYIQLFN